MGAVGFLVSVAGSEVHSSNSSSTAGSEGPPSATSDAAPVQMHESRSLGISIDATQHEHAHLAGVGLLLPAWRQVADILAPLCHRVPPLPIFLCRSAIGLIAAECCK